ncbi:MULTISPECIES: MSMEG_0570 family nitrogen starvation response protein [unclassified Burkholderia]|uniref:MSMEG_0570 family nitrogen starvation response protein n=1 Tax=unclassified Burkholderia TaxID=2613784 RepID=UPI001420873B|nr:MULTISPECIES: MSMEG_0570 family nitrogen starvation response protein [unclassified Burkholderia]NIF73722.1 MSMEG_0570 family nitrogen starvation response protein [Burkholderia sp. Ap-962]NIF88929.1 MSMEG_0570 family nitrogen starvation response protein [Burkholderia sp. Cy-637]
MPVMHFRVRWPDATETRCYSPSTVVADYFTPGSEYPLADFVARSRESLGIASERVRAKFGFACSAAMDELARIEALAERFGQQAEASVTVLALE